MNKIASLILVLAFCSLNNQALAHFGMVIPSTPTVMENKDANINLEVKFWHPFENSGMNLVKPKSFTLFTSGKSIDLLSKLVETKQRTFVTWQLPYKLERPGLYTFVLEPEPYFEPEEDCFIIHYTKTYVDAFGDNEGWNEPTPGLKTEIIPLVKPVALYAGNVFTGKVLLDGKPVPGSEVEIEWYPGTNLAGEAPYKSMVTQVVITDDNGIFNYAAPAPGWWGFAGLNAADYKLKENGQDKDVELGAVLWLYFHKFNPDKPISE